MTAFRIPGPPRIASWRIARGVRGLDHELPLDQNGIWGRNYQTGLEYGVVAVEVAGSLWFGNNDEIGHSFWQTVDSSVISGAARP